MVTTTAGLLSVMTTLQRGLMNRTRGLYGNWDGDPSDDFKDPDGMILPANATMEEIHYGFAQKCRQPVFLMFQIILWHQLS